MARMESVVDDVAQVEVGAPRFDVVVIGAGQAMGYELKQQGRWFVILEGRERVGDIWRSRWDSLRLFSPARYDALPGMPFPAPPHSFPTRDEIADYLESYAAQNALPARTGTRVDGVWSAGEGQDGFIVTAGDLRIQAAQVVVATGAEDRPSVPAFAGELDPGIRQMHSSAYQNPSQFQEGDVLVVGAGNSGAEIAIEAAREHHTILSGRHTGHVPFRIDRPAARFIFPVLWFVANRVLTLDTPLGRRIGPAVRSDHGGPLVRTKPSDVLAAGVERTYSRTVGVRDGRPMLDDGRVLDVANVVWSTGFRHDFSWIHLPAFDESGYPLHRRGVVDSVPGLFFIGLPFLHAFGSMLIGGAARDAAYVAGKIAARAGVR